MRDVRDHYLPIDHDAFVGAEPPSGRVIVIAPTRAACETIELAVGLHIETYLEKQEDAVTLAVGFSTLADGTSYTARTTLEAKAKNISVVIENSGHRPLAK